MAILFPLLLALAFAVVSMGFRVWQTHKMLDANSHPLKDAALTRLTARMATALDIPAIPVHIYDIEPVNGLAAPDGRIFLTTGFVKKYQQGVVSDEEMASVIAHEMGHVALGHSKRRMIDVTGQSAVFMLLTAFLSRFLPFVGVWAANALSTALMARLSRRDEFEADAYASALLIKSGIGTAPQKSLFRKLDRLTKSAGDGIPAWLRSHPHTEERIKAIEANEARWFATA